MEGESSFSPLNSLASWYPSHEGFALIAGPCSAENEAQVLESAEVAKSLGAQVMRAGVWKPRTRPGSFEGRGGVALEWLQAAQAETGIPFMLEVASPEHLELALKAGAFAVWLGARTTVSPFAVQELADALRGVDIPVLLKNPINPDVELWQGAIERMQRVGVTKLATVHRGFSSYDRQSMRNPPHWALAIELRRRMPELPIFADPSHIAGIASMVPQVSQHALDLGYDGLMVEVHPDPTIALSDAKQQLSPALATEMLSTLHRPKVESESNASELLAELRSQVDEVDEELLGILARRMKLIEALGTTKNVHGLALLQPNRWSEVVKSRTKAAVDQGLSEAYILKLLQVIHQESLAVQTEIRRKEASEKSIEPAENAEILN